MPSKKPSCSKCTRRRWSFAISTTSGFPGKERSRRWHASVKTGVISMLRLPTGSIPRSAGDNRGRPLRYLSRGPESDTWCGNREDAARSRGQQGRDEPESGHHRRLSSHDQATSSLAQSHSRHLRPPNGGDRGRPDSYDQQESPGETLGRSFHPRRGARQTIDRGDVWRIASAVKDLASFFLLIRPAWRGLQKLAELLLPESRLAGRAVAGGLVACGDQKHAAVFDTLDLTVQHPGLRRIALVVRGVDRQQNRLNALQAW